MGAVFTMPWATVADGAAGIRAAREAGMTTVALDPDGGVSLRAYRPSGPVLLLVGTEGPGLTPAARAATDVLVRIPMARGTDSLNVATAVALGCWALTGE
jgi:tRNA G18 (ribose-2'-O)-methylase SpoU